jgi:hypothetical protein
MRMTYEYTVEDMICTSKFLARKGGPVRNASAARDRALFWIMLAMTSLLVSAPLFILARPRNQDPQHLGLLAVAVSLTIIILGIALLARTMKGQSERVFGQLQRQNAIGKVPRMIEVELRDDGVHFQSDAGTTVLRWHALYAIEENEQYIYFQPSAVLAHAVAKRGFATPGEGQAFLDEARRRRGRVAAEPEGTSL